MRPIQLDLSSDIKDPYGHEEGRPCAWDAVRSSVYSSIRPRYQEDYEIKLSPNNTATYSSGDGFVIINGEEVPVSAIQKLIQITQQ